MSDQHAPEPIGRAIIEVVPGVWVATAQIWTTTSAVVVAPDGAALVVDPGITVEELRGLAAEIDRRGWHVTGGFTTHPHWDHVLWSDALGTGPRWATAGTVTEIRRLADQARRDAEGAAPGHDLDLITNLEPLPDDPAGELPWTGRPVTFVEHAAHAPGHAALVVDGAMLAGDMLSDVEVPILDEDADDPIGDHRRALTILEDAARRGGVRVVVPGHGHPAYGTEEIAARFAADRAYLHALERLAARAGDDTAIADPRAQSGYVAQWHVEQLGRLRAARRGEPAAR